MQQTITVNNTPYPLKIRKNARAKRMVLRLSPCGQEVRLTLPRYVNEKTGYAFLTQQQSWLEQQLAEKSDIVAFAPDITLPLFGDTLTLRHTAQQRGTHLNDTLLQVGGDIAYFPRRVEDWIRKQAKMRFSEEALTLAQTINQQPASVSIRSTTSRWGSCSRQRRLNFSWRLAFAPASVATYVIAHEVAHLQHFDHSPAFWQCVEAIDPEWKSAKSWLTEHGQTLHRYGSR